MSKRLFVGNLSYGTTEPALRSVFQERGWEVQDVVIVTDRETGRSRGFGFVELAVDGDADAAMEQLDGFELDGRSLTVREAHDRPAKGNRAPRGGPASFDVEHRGGEGRRRGGHRGGGPRRYDDDEW